MTSVCVPTLEQILYSMRRLPNNTSLVSGDVWCVAIYENNHVERFNGNADSVVERQLVVEFYLEIRYEKFLGRVFAKNIWIYSGQVDVAGTTVEFTKEAWIGLIESVFENSEHEINYRNCTIQRYSTEDEENYDWYVSVVC